MSAATKVAPKTKPAAKISQAKGKTNATRELPTISAVKLVPLALIDVLPQVRTVFDDESIADLAKDIEARGLLQPVLLNPHGDRYTLIAGERRVRACKLLQLTDIPALITKASSADALLMQLAENIQREDLDLADQVKAIRNLHNHLQSVAAVADTVKKSSAWVSKRLALSHEDLDWEAKRLMEDGVTEDLEILNTLNALSNINWPAANEQYKAMRAGTATRESVRQALKEAKAQQAAAKAAPAAPDMTPEQRKAIEIERETATKARNKQKAEEERQRTKGTGPAFVEWALRELQEKCAEPNDAETTATQFLNALEEKQRAALVTYLRAYQETAKAWTFEEWAWCLTPWNRETSYLEQYAAVMALKGQEVDNLYALVAILEAANKEQE